MRVRVTADAGVVERRVENDLDSGRLIRVRPDLRDEGVFRLRPRLSADRKGRRSRSEPPCPLKSLESPRPSGAGDNLSL